MNISNLLDKKKLLVVAVIVLVALFITQLYFTFATNSTVAEADNVYDITFTDSDIINIPAKSSKIVYYQLCNTNKGTVQYGVGYDTDNTEVVVKGYWDSIDPLSGTIDYGENKFIKLKISNHSTTDANLTLTTVLGYENGGDLPSTSSTLVTDVVNEYNYMMYYTSSHSATYYFLNSELKNDQIQSIVFTGDNIVPDGYTSKDVSKDSDGTVVMWYGETNDDGLYDVYIGSDNGITSFYSGYYLFGRLTYLEYIDFTRSDTSKVTNMYRMFSETGYSASEFSLDLSNFNTSNVNDMSYMFDRTGYSVSEWSIGDLSNWDTSSVTSMMNMFYQAGYSATEWSIGNLNNWDTSSVTSMLFMFSYAGYSATEWNIGDLSNWDTSNVTDMTYMFYGAGYSSTNEWTLDLSTKEVTKEDGSTYTAWDVSNVTSHDTFSGGNGKGTIIVPTWAS